MQMIEPMAIAACIPEAPASPVNFRIRVAISSVAIAMPETGLLLLPTSPTMRDETVAKKKPKITTMMAPTSETGMAGISQTARVSTRMASRTSFILRS